MTTRHNIWETEMGNELIPIAKNSQQRAKAVFTPHVDIIETLDAMTLYADMPGVEAEDLDIRVHEGELAIAATTRERDAATGWIVREYEVGSFYRSFQLSDDFNATAISAELRNGELRVHLPKVERVKPIKIEVIAG